MSDNPTIESIQEDDLADEALDRRFNEMIKVSVSCVRCNQ